MPHIPPTETVTLILPKAMQDGAAGLGRVFVGDRELKGIRKLTVSFEADVVIPAVTMEFDCLSGLRIEYVDDVETP